MKKYLQAALLWLIVASAAAQTPAPKMELRATGFIGPDSVNHYVVIQAPKVSKADLFKRTLTYVNGLYKNPQVVVSAVDGESITINAVTEAIRSSNLDWYRYPMSYNIVIEFKEGKIKFEPKVISIKEISSARSEPENYYVSSKDSPKDVEINCIWIINKKNGEPFLFKKDLKATADQWINDYIAGIVQKVNDNW